MSQLSQQPLKPVLSASVHDVRYFAALLRGLNFTNTQKATVMAYKAGLVITVEEARTLLATAFAKTEIFDEFTYTHPPSEPHSPSQRQRRANLSQDSMVDDQPHPDVDDAEKESTAFEIPLNTLIECLNIFGTAGPLPAASAGTTKRKWKRAGEGGDDMDRDDGNERVRGPMDTFFGGGKDDKRTGMRMSFQGPGYPLTLLIAEDATGPTTTCDITTFDPEPSLQLEFDRESTVLEIILKSSWLRDALSEIDPSCDRLTFIANPPGQQATGGSGTRLKPILRIKAAGTFGSTEMDYPNDKEVLESFICTHAVSVSYHTAYIARAARGLTSSSKTSLRIDEGGLLSLQFLLPGAPGGAGSNKQKDAFIDFRCLALDTET
ncbi:hypothetical protein HWV62_10018 [Athelia sp. TMB]|nr:hypothetical protein HWV62_10018 [Athelia sp. TMB]